MHRPRLEKIFLIGHSMGVRITAQAALFSLATKNISPSIKGLIWINDSNYTLKATAVSDVTSTIPENSAAAKHAIYLQIVSAKTPGTFKAEAGARVAALGMVYSENLLKDMMMWDWEDMKGCFERLGGMAVLVLSLQSSEPVGMERVPIREDGWSRFMGWVDEKRGKGS